MGYFDILTSSGAIYLAIVLILWTFWFYAMVTMLHKIKLVIFGVKK